MRISFYTNPGDLQLNNGYGYAGYNFVSALKALGHEVPFNDDTAEVQINFCWPTWFRDYIRPNQYTIAYTPWESTELPADWVDIFNQCDEVWTTSPWVATVYEQAGVVKPIFVVEHGVTEDWQPLKRFIHNKLSFLHQGEPAPRKNGQLAFDAFKAAFGDSTDVSLTLKTSSSTLMTVREGQGISYSQPSGNVRVETGILEYADLIGLYHTHHAFVYPSAGEGFGLMPLQAMATGMPTICTGEWAPYRKYLGDLELPAQPVDSLWPHIHPGKMYHIELDDLVDKYRYLYNNFDAESDRAFSNSFSLHSGYDWAEIIKSPVQGLIKRLKDRK